MFGCRSKASKPSNQEKSEGASISPMESPKILLVEDEPHLAFNIEYHLKSEGFEVLVAEHGKKGLEYFHREGPFNLIILDIMLPELSGLDLCKLIRLEDKTTAILLLTAMSQDDDIISGLEAGADDYVTKPFVLKELLLRVKRMVERSFLLNPSKDPEAVVEQGPFRLDMEGLTLENAGVVHQLTLLETKVLAAFLQNPGKTFSREELLRDVWGVKGTQETRTVDNFVLRIRKIIEKNPARPVFLKSIRGLGYRLEIDDRPS